MSNNLYKKVAIIQPNYIPWKGYFDIINMVDEFVIYDDVQYTKNDWRNRNKIKTNTGVIWVTIPVKHSISQKIYDVTVLNKNWRKKHWSTISQNYSKSTYFKYYKIIFEELYLNSEEKYLTSINLEFILKINEILGILTNISCSHDYNLTEGRIERLIDLVKKVNGKEYISGPAAKNYINEKMFNENGIKLSWMDYNNYPLYNQLFPPFEHGVSILDLIFNEGPNAIKFLKSFTNTNDNKK